ncbi:MAG: exonuclease domain-containing protein [Chthoniobacterales bacterium]
MIGRQKFLAIDFESARTQRLGGGDLPIQIATIASLNLEIKTSTAKKFFLSPSEPVVLTRADVHGITHKDLENAPTLLELWPKLSDDLQGSPLIAHGAGTERRFLRAFPFSKIGPWIDTLFLSKKIYPGLDSYALGSLVARLGIEDELRNYFPNGRWHEALFDAAACLLLFHHLVRSGGLQDKPLAWLLADES